MRILALSIRGFRGIETADLVFGDHTVLVGPNCVGKSTVIDALSLVFGRSKLVPTLTEHDFTGSTPGRPARISIVATLGGFTPNDAEAHRGSWFRPGRGVEKYWSASQKKVLPERAANGDQLCVQVGLCARFDHDELAVEQLRYFHDDDVDDAFEEDLAPFPHFLLKDIGFYVLPARRTWDLALSFASELFRKAVDSVGGVPSSAVLTIRDQVRAPSTPIEQDAAIAPLVKAVNDRLARLLPGQPTLQIRLTATDSDAVLKALVPHYVIANGTSLPAARHGGGLVALQTLIILLETGRARRAQGQSFILALEEPELHVAPGLQGQIVSEATAIASQTICTTHSPRVASCYSSQLVQVVRRVGGALTAKPLLTEPSTAIPNAARRLLVDERQRLLEALMYRVMVIPEGRIDLEFLRLFVQIAQGPESGGGASGFETTVGIVPTPDASVVGTFQRLRELRDGIVVIVDGDSAGDKYVRDLLALPAPPAAIVQWPAGAMIEDVVAWIAAADAPVIQDVASRISTPLSSTTALADRLRSDDRKLGGLKGNYPAYEEVAFALKSSTKCAERAREFLEALAAIGAGLTVGPLFASDTSKTTATTTVLRFLAP